MHDHTPEHPEPNIEGSIATDEVLTPKSALLVAVVLAVCCISVVIISYFLIRAWSPPDQPQSASPDLQLQRPTAMPAPRLQSEPGVDMKQFSTRQQVEMNGYGWVDKQKGIVHIPIERAIEITAKKGLPARPAAAGGKH